MNNPIYKPKGKAAEYGDYALNIYTGCPHRCWYCFAPNVLYRDKELFHTVVRPRDGIVEAVEKQLACGEIKDKLIHLCFTCDPYPKGYDTTVTREIITLIKASGNHVQILTKNPIERDFDLLDDNDWYGVSITGEINSDHALHPLARLTIMEKEWEHGINTWISFEPVIDADMVLFHLEKLLNIGTRDNPLFGRGVHADKVKIGKLNYHSSGINWAQFGRDAERICKERGVDYYIKDSLRAEMDKA